MKIESQVLSLSWIPSEAVKGVAKLGFEMGPLHYDEAPPDAIADDAHLEEMRVADAFRFGNRLTGWIEVDDGKITSYGQGGGPLMGATTLQLGPGAATFAGVLFPEIIPEPEVGETSVTFRQTVGGCTGVPAPRPVRHKPFVQYHAPTVWSTLALTIHADGRSEFKVEGASKFPRHWFYDADLKLAAKSGLADYKEWWKHSFGERTPWGDADSPALITEVESAYERQMSGTIIREGKPKVRKIKEGADLWKQGDEGTSICLLLDGVIEVVVDDEPLALLGPGALMGERAVLEGGKRTATLHATTPVRVAEARKVELDLDVLAEISKGHRREEDR